MISEKEKQNREELFRLMQENPDLPVVPMVYSEVVAGGDLGFWMGSWGEARIMEYLLSENEDDAIIFKSDYCELETLEKCLPYEEFEQLPENEAECKPIYDALPWIKTIIVYVDTP